jgi:hypothetical protein
MSAMICNSRVIFLFLSIAILFQGIFLEANQNLSPRSYLAAMERFAKAFPQEGGIKILTTRHHIDFMDDGGMSGRS